MSRVGWWSWGEPLEPLRRALSAGAPIALPTESSYSLAVDPHNERGVARVFMVKGRASGSPLPVVASSRAQIEALGCRFDDPRLEALAELWPAPLSLLLPLSGDLSAAAGSHRLAVRIPAHPRLRRLLDSLGIGLTATSANRSDEPPLTRPERVRELLADEPGAMVVDDGRLAGGNPSTLVGVSEGKIEVLRRGAVSEEALKVCLGAGIDERFSAASVEIFADESR